MKEYHSKKKTENCCLRQLQGCVQSCTHMVPFTKKCRQQHG